MDHDTAIEAAEPTDGADQAKKSKFATINLNEPIVRGATKIESFTLRKPIGGELRGCNLQNLVQCDVTEILRVIPRVSNPPLTQFEADGLEADDLAECAGALKGFFMTSAERQMIEAMMAEYQPKG
jgi:hypothetical protein